MRIIPSIQKMLITLESVFRDIFFESTTNITDTLTTKDSTKLENVLTVNINSYDFTIYVSVSEYQVDLFIRDDITYKTKNRYRYSYDDFITYEGLITQIILDVYSICRAQRYE